MLTKALFQSMEILRKTLIRPLRRPSITLFLHKPSCQTVMILLSLLYPPIIRCELLEISQA